MDDSIRFDFNCAEDRNFLNELVLSNTLITLESSFKQQYWIRPFVLYSHFRAFLNFHYFLFDNLGNKI